MKSQNSVPIEYQYFIDSLAGLLKSGSGNAFTSDFLVETEMMRFRTDVIQSRKECDSRELITLLSPSHCKKKCNKLSYSRSLVIDHPKYEQLVVAYEKPTTGGLYVEKPVHIYFLERMYYMHS